MKRRRIRRLTCLRIIRRSQKTMRQAP